MWASSLLALVLGILKYISKFCRGGRVKPRATSPNPKPRPSPPRLPVEIIEKCVDFLFEVRSSTTNRGSIRNTKPAWGDVSWLMEASPELHKMGYIRWVVILTVRHSDDWGRAKPYAYAIRELHCLNGVLENARDCRVLAEFNRLHSLSVDAHGDVTHDERDRFAYRDLFLSLPSSLRCLEIIHAHGPDVHVINIVKKYAPNLEELRLGRCTLFNRPEACPFWESFPLEHDSYMSIEDTDSYARSLAKELAPLRSLQTLALGLYLVPSTTILAHRLYHRRGMVAPEVVEWQQAIPTVALLGDMTPDEVALHGIQPASLDQLTAVLHQHDPEEEFGSEAICNLCVGEVAQLGNNAEARASLILRERLPHLASVQWMAWLSAGHLGINEHRF